MGGEEDSDAREGLREWKVEVRVWRVWRMEGGGGFAVVIVVRWRGDGGG